MAQSLLSPSFADNHKFHTRNSRTDRTRTDFVYPHSTSNLLDHLFQVEEPKPEPAKTCSGVCSVGLLVAQEPVTARFIITGLTVKGKEQASRVWRGDIIVQINGHGASSLSLDDINSLLAGPTGSCAEIILLRPIPVEDTYSRSQWRGMAGSKEVAAGVLYTLLAPRFCPEIRGTKTVEEFTPPAEPAITINTPPTSQPSDDSSRAPAAPRAAGLDKAALGAGAAARKAAADDAAGAAAAEAAAATQQKFDNAEDEVRHILDTVQSSFIPPAAVELASQAVKAQGQGAADARATRVAVGLFRILAQQAEQLAASYKAEAYVQMLLKEAEQRLAAQRVEMQAVAADNVQVRRTLASLRETYDKEAKRVAQQRDLTEARMSAEISALRRALEHDSHYAELKKKAGALLAEKRGDAARGAQLDSRRTKADATEAERLTDLEALSLTNAELVLELHREKLERASLEARVAAAEDTSRRGDEEVQRLTKKLAEAAGPKAAGVVAMGRWLSLVHRGRMDDLDQYESRAFTADQTCKELETLEKERRAELAVLKADKISLTEELATLRAHAATVQAKLDALSASTQAEIHRVLSEAETRVRTAEESRDYALQAAARASAARPATGGGGGEGEEGGGAGKLVAALREALRVATRELHGARDKIRSSQEALAAKDRELREARAESSKLQDKVHARLEEDKDRIMAQRGPQLRDSQ